MPKLLEVAIVQAAPVPLSLDHGIQQATKLASDALNQGAKLVAFGETFLGGYPIWLDEAPGAALWDHPGSKALHRILMDQSIIPGDRRLTPLQQLADDHNACISIGAHERIRSSIYNNQLLLRPNLEPLDHRKLVPTHGERLIWNRGDGSTINVHQSGWGRIGNLICWEHWMPLARAAMHNLAEDVHVAAWPTVRESYQIASRHYAFEGRCHVLAAGTVLHRNDLLEGIKLTGNDPEAKSLAMEIQDGQLQFGQSQIIAPDATVIARAGDTQETLMTEIDLDIGKEARAALDVDGHYSRPDIFDLTVNMAATPGVRWSNGGEDDSH